MAQEEKTRGKAPVRPLFEEDGPYDLEEFHKVFIECEDPTEYKPAMQLTGAITEWERFKRDWPTFRANLTEWHHELELLLQSRAIARIKTVMEEGSDTQAMTAAKFFATKEYKRRAGAGRPSVKETQKEISELARAASETEEEAKRIENVLKFTPKVG